MGRMTRFDGFEIIRPLPPETPDGPHTHTAHRAGCGKCELLWINADARPFVTCDVCGATLENSFGVLGDHMLELHEELGDPWAFAQWLARIRGHLPRGCMG